MRAGERTFFVCTRECVVVCACMRVCMRVDACVRARGCVCMRAHVTESAREGATGHRHFPAIKGACVRVSIPEPLLQTTQSNHAPPAGSNYQQLPVHPVCVVPILAALPSLLLSAMCLHRLRLSFGFCDRTRSQPCSRVRVLGCLWMKRRLRRLSTALQRDCRCGCVRAGASISTRGAYMKRRASCTQPSSDHCRFANRRTVHASQCQAQSFSSLSLPPCRALWRVVVRQKWCTCRILLRDIKRRHLQVGHQRSREVALDVAGLAACAHAHRYHHPHLLIHADLPMCTAHRALDRTCPRDHSRGRAERQSSTPASPLPAPQSASSLPRPPPPLNDF